LHSAISKIGDNFMNFLGNVVWLVFGGFFAALGYIAGGLLMCLTIVGIPFGIQQIKIGIATLAPFGKEVVSSPERDSALYIILNLVWAVFFGWEIALIHLSHALVLTLTVIGIPFAVQHIKLVPLSLMPFGLNLE
jgi:uncharacterized membrane protein YccF (DUF307 family)